jgi:hypothetical protein
MIIYRLNNAIQVIQSPVSDSRDCEYARFNGQVEAVSGTGDCEFGFRLEGIDADES